MSLARINFLSHLDSIILILFAYTYDLFAVWKPSPPEAAYKYGYDKRGSKDDQADHGHIIYDILIFCT